MILTETIDTAFAVRLITTGAHFLWQGNIARPSRWQVRGGQFALPSQRLRPVMVCK